MTDIVLPPSCLDARTSYVNVTVNVYAPVDVYINRMMVPIPVTPGMTPGSTHDNPRPKPESSDDYHARRRGKEKGGKSRIPPGSVDYEWVIDRHIDYLWLRGFDHNVSLLHDHPLLFGVPQVTRGLRPGPQFLNGIHHFVFLIQKGVA
jgi:hypothetical protein